MPVRKYSSVAEMPGPTPRRPLDPENLRIACELSELAFALHPWRLEPGVRKFSSADEADRHRRRRERLQTSFRSGLSDLSVNHDRYLAEAFGEELE